MGKRGRLWINRDSPRVVPFRAPSRPLPKVGCADRYLEVAVRREMSRLFQPFIMAEMDQFCHLRWKKSVDKRAGAGKGVG